MKKYFDMPVAKQDKPWAPHYCCAHCKKTLEGWLRGEKHSMKFYKPRIWLEPTDHSTNCFFCSVDVSKKRKGKDSSIKYPDIPWSTAAIPRSSQYPVPVPAFSDASLEGGSIEGENATESDGFLADRLKTLLTSQTKKK